MLLIGKGKGVIFECADSCEHALPAQTGLPIPFQLDDEQSVLGELRLLRKYGNQLSIQIWLSNRVGGDYSRPNSSGTPNNTGWNDSIQSMCHHYTVYDSQPNIFLLSSSIWVTGLSWGHLTLLNRYSNWRLNIRHYCCCWHTWYCLGFRPWFLDTSCVKMWTQMGRCQAPRGTWSLTTRSRAAIRVGICSGLFGLW